MWNTLWKLIGYINSKIDIYEQTHKGLIWKKIHHACVGSISMWKGENMHLMHGIPPPYMTCIV